MSERPKHYTEALDMLENAAYQAALYMHLDALWGSMCTALGMENGELVIAAVRERAKRKVRAELAKVVRQLR